MTESKASLAPLIIAFLALAGVLGPGPASAQNQSLYSVSPRDTKLRTLDPASGVTLASKTIQLSGTGTVGGGNALATHPLTGELFAILFDSTIRKRILATVDPATGIAEERALTSGAPGVSALAFDSTGRLFSAFAANNHPDFANKLFEVDTDTGVQTFFTDLGDSEAGNALAFNPNDGMLYHLSGTDFFGIPFVAVFEKIDLATKARTAISVSGAALEHVRAMTFAPSGHFLVTGGLQEGFTTDRLFRLTPGGFATMLATLDHRPKGLAFELPPNEVPLAASMPWLELLLLDD